MQSRRGLWARALLFASASLGGLTGCNTTPLYPGVEPAPYTAARASAGSGFAADPRFDHALPRELQKVSHPEYIVEPPDILRIELLRVVPTTDYKVEAQDVLSIQITYPAQTEPFGGELLIGPDGIVNLGQTFGGAIKVTGQTIDEIRKAIEAQALKANVKEPKVFVSLVSSRVLSPIRGEYLIRQDGSIGLGSYGNVRVVGQTLTQVKQTIELHLGQRLVNPEVSVDVAAYNSKVFYVIYDGGGRGQQVVRLPITGNETVLDAVSQLNGLSTVSSTHHMSLARPSPAALNQEMILPIDWNSVTKAAGTGTNYQLMPGDRLYVRANPLVEADNWVGMLLSPIERMLGATLLGQTTVQAIQNPTTIGGGGSR